MKKTAQIFLGKDSTQWVKKIITSFLNEYPVLQNYPINVVWKKQNPEIGYAVGSLNILNGVVPIIIKEFQLADLDVIMFGQYAQPLTPITVNEMVQNNRPFSGIAGVASKGSLQIFGDGHVNFSPVDSAEKAMQQEGSTIRDAVKVASFIGAIENVDKKSVEEILNTIKADPIIKLSFDKNKTLDVLKELKNKTLLTKEASLEKYLRDIKIDRSFVYTDEEGNTFVKTASSKVDAEWENQITEKELASLPQVLKCAEEKVISIPESTRLVTEILPEPGVFGRFEDGNMVTPEVQIVSVEKVAKLADTTYLQISNTNDGLLIDKELNFIKTASSVDSAICDNSVALENSDPQLNDVGVFVLNNKALTPPFTVIEMQKVANAGGYELTVDHGLSVKNYSVTKIASEDLVPHEYLTNHFYLPKGTAFVKLNSEKNEVVKTASAKLAANGVLVKISALQAMQPVNFYITTNVNEKSDGINLSTSASFKNITEKIAEYNVVVNNNTVHRDSSGLFNLSGRAFDKYASLNKNIRDLNLVDTQWTLVKLGASEKDVLAVANMGINDVHTINNPLNVPISLNELEKAAEDLYKNEFQKTDLIDIDTIVKFAAAIPEQNTVDALLSLGLMKKNNILEFVNLVPDYERVAGELAKLLVMIRLGLGDINESPVKGAMEYLVRVITSLKQVGTTAVKKSA